MMFYMVQIKGYMSVAVACRLVMLLSKDNVLYSHSYSHWS